MSVFARMPNRDGTRIDEDVSAPPVNIGSLVYQPENRRIKMGATSLAANRR
jgi:hypothetical protein